MFDSDQDLSLLRRLRQGILFARERVYRIASPTPLERIDGIGEAEVFVKREDISPIKAYKWRGAYNRMAVLSEDEKKRGVITASAGNHAQGVALAADALGVDATIYMPQTTPLVKQRAVSKLGGSRVTIVLHGDSYDDACTAALAKSEAEELLYVHAYDDLQVMAGQATLADEVVMSGEGPFDVAYLQIGGGGMAAGVAAWLKTYYPDIHIVGVEGTGQASMKAAVAAGEPVRLPELDIFCDGTAVRKAGELPFEICKDLIDEFVTVSNHEVSEAIRLYWDRLRCLSEPSGAMGLAGAWQQRAKLKAKRVLVVLCGANIDFNRLATIAGEVGEGDQIRSYFRIEIPERSGSMLTLLNDAFDGVGIRAFQYGKNNGDLARPLFSITGTELKLEKVRNALRDKGYAFEELGESDEVRYRLVPLRSDLLTAPLFLDLEFYERPGALRSYLTETIRGRGSFCYFNYVYSGERVGRALIGIDFETDLERKEFLADLATSGDGFRSCRPLGEDATQHLMG
ncbi:pyridoxal-phosphate dependent enzyme [Verrucomicrobiales bacterium]|nr:pyridoxal-phosphate dependent enzyme [Verrucomicrobiales bacterium]MDB4358854.1 pyridoxal-phosphate dependent enzyme [Verrucomicrobiales bacterium]